jgi:hypothetical protein
LTFTRRTFSANVWRNCIANSAEFNAMVTETRALLSLYAELGRRLATHEVSAADQTWPAAC